MDSWIHLAYSYYLDIWYPFSGFTELWAINVNIRTSLIKKHKASLQEEKKVPDIL